MAGGRPLKFSTPEELRERGMEYINECKINNSKILITGLALALECDRDTLLNYEARDEFFGTVRELKLYCENYAESMLFEGSASGAIFALKNHGWRDKTEVDSTINQNTTVSIEGSEALKGLANSLGQNIKDSYAKGTDGS